MAIVKGSYSSLVRGVSEQVNHDRLEGQHTEQVNMVSDPIRGLIRRRGSKFEDSLPYLELTKAQRNGFREFAFNAFGDNFSVAYQKEPNNLDQPLFVFNTSTDKFIKEYNITPVALQRAKSGITSMTALGRYIIASTNTEPSFSSTNEVNTWAKDGAIWIRGGAYSRTYTIRWADKVVTYTTPKSYFEGTLDTSTIPFDDPEYQKKVNDLVNDYNTQVNQYIAEAQEAIQPENIADQLANAMLSQGFSLYKEGTHIHVFNLGTSSRLTGDDGGDGSFMRVTHREVSSLDSLTRKHQPGVVVKVAVSDDDYYYVKAEAKRDGDTSFQEVSWVESAGESLSIDFPFLIGTVYDDKLYLGHSPFSLESILPNGNGLTVPRLVDRKSGDEETNPVPEFLKRKTSHLTVVQDRLLVCSGANVFMSVPGDYFNWFRKSSLRVDPDDPIEVYALGSENDTIKGSATIERSLVFIGESNHYVMPARDVLSPTTASIAVQAREEGTDLTSPVSSGAYLFFTQRQGGSTNVHQMQVGNFSDSFSKFSVSQQINRYIKGRPRQIQASTDPNTLMLLSEDYDGLYVFQYLDTPGEGERLFDSWSRWSWDSSLGAPVSIGANPDGFLVFTNRNIGGEWYLVADSFSKDSSTDDAPYLDSQRPLADLEEGEGEGYSAVLPRSHSRSLSGVPIEDVDSLLSRSDVTEDDVLVGKLFESFVELTPPFLRDDRDNAILDGRSILTSMGISLAESAGVVVKLKDRGSQGFDMTLVDDAGFRISGINSLLGAVPVASRRVSVYVGRELREHALRIYSRTWTPLTIATIEWTMQVFNRR